ncbi:MAG: beta-galactosidase [Candidatus Brocadiaceae bacterium]|nr:beta-galactosidase [Candidatus Brocadiaceae bacterium]
MKLPRSIITIAIIVAFSAFLSCTNRINGEKSPETSGKQPEKKQQTFRDGTLLEKKKQALKGGIFTKAVWEGKSISRLEEILKIPHLRGLLVACRWNIFEPEEGKYNWEYIDSVIQQAERKNHYVCIAITPGVWTPDWVYKKGISVLHFKNTQKTERSLYGKDYRCPRVWEQEYLDIFLKTIDALGKRYDNNPRVIRVGVSGPILFYNELHIQSRLIPAMEREGFTIEKYIDAWEYAFDSYAFSFPNTPLMVFMVPLDGDIEPLNVFTQNIVDKHRDQCVFGCANLADKWMKSPKQPLVRLYETLSSLPADIPIGFEIGEYHMGDGPSHAHRMEEQKPEIYGRVVDWAIDLKAWFIHAEEKRLLNPANNQIYERFRKFNQDKQSLAQPGDNQK